MLKLGDYEWRQLSIWDFAPKDCIEKFVCSGDAKHIFHYYLMVVENVISDNHIQTRAVVTLDGVPEDVLNWRNGNYALRQNGKNVK